MKKLFLVLSVGFFVLLIYGFYAWKILNKDRIVISNDQEFIRQTENGYQLIRNGAPFYIRGASGNSRLKELADIGGNVIRVYDTLNLAQILDEAHKNNLQVIVDIYMPRFQNYSNPYLNRENNKKRKENVLQLVRKYKSHPAVLFWNLGNELQYPVIVKNQGFLDNLKDYANIIKTLLNRRSFIRNFNEIIDIIHQEDNVHLVSTSITTNSFFYKVFNIHFFSPKLDLIGINVFGPVQDIKNQLAKLDKMITLKPYYISEWGIAGPWEQELTLWNAPIEPTSSKKGEQYIEKFKQLDKMDNKLLGTVAFYWGQKQERTHTWFNIFDSEGRKSEAYYDLQKTWLNQPELKMNLPKINYMLVDQKGARDNLVFKPGEKKNAQLVMAVEADSAFRFNWEIYEEGWNYEGGGAAHKNTKKIDTYFDNVNQSKINFEVPETEGPYRLFVYVYDHFGNFATTNTPFYVLNPDE